MSKNEKLPNQVEKPEVESNLPDGAEVVRKVSVNQLQKEREVTPLEAFAKRVTLISLGEDTFLVVVRDPTALPVDGDRVTEDGLSEEKARKKVLSLFGKRAYLDAGVWERALLSAQAGVKVLLELSDQPLILPEADPKYPIRIGR